MRYTIVLDEYVAAKVKQLFNGNLSRGLNTLVKERLQEKDKKISGFGLFKGEGKALREELRKLREDDQVD